MYYLEFPLGCKSVINSEWLLVAKLMIIFQINANKLKSFSIYRVFFDLSHSKYTVMRQKDGLSPVGRVWRLSPFRRAYISCFRTKRVG